MLEDTPKPIIEHLIEFRKVLLLSAIYMVIGILISMSFSEAIFDFLIKPLKSAFKEDTYMIYTSISEIISTELRVMCYSGFLTTFPLICWQLWSFVRPGLRRNEITIICKYYWLSLLLFFAGVLFSYYIVTPNVAKFIMNWPLSSHAVFQPKISEGLSFVLGTMVSFGVAFQIPIVMLILDHLRIVSLSKQRRMWREYIIGIAIVSAIITPPDIFSMICMMLPFVLLYYLTFLFSLRKLK